MRACPSVRMDREMDPPQPSPWRWRLRRLRCEVLELKESMTGKNVEKDKKNKAHDLNSMYVARKDLVHVGKHGEPVSAASVRNEGIYMASLEENSIEMPISSLGTATKDKKHELR